MKPATDVGLTWWGHASATVELGRVRVVVSAAVADLRRIIDGLRPPALDEVGLAGAIRDRLLPLIFIAPAVLMPGSAWQHNK